MRADTFGLREIAKAADGLVVIDDSTQYHGGTEEGGRYAARNVSVRVTEIGDQDVVFGTHEKIVETCKEYCNYNRPEFILIGAAPAASMIGTDLRAAADEAGKELKLPAAAVDVKGYGTFDHGISKGLAALGELFVCPAEACEGTVNIIGGTPLDLGRDNLPALQEWVEKQGWKILSCWGSRERIERYRNAGSAQVNLVCTESGLALARQMEQSCGIPYIAAVPMGRAWSQKTAEALKSGRQPAVTRAKAGEKALIIGEQFIGNAIRETLLSEYQFGEVTVSSFTAMDQALMQENDRYLRSEEELEQLLEGHSDSLVIADRMYRYNVPEHSRWLELPCKGLLTPTDPMPELIGGALNRWLDQYL